MEINYSKSCQIQINANKANKKIFQHNDNSFPICEPTQVCRYLGIAIAAHETDETPYHYALQKFYKKIERLKRFSPQATSVLLNTIIYPAFNHIHSVTPLPNSVHKKIINATYIALGGTLSKTNPNRIHYNKIPLTTLQLPWANGGCNLLRVKDHAYALQAKIWGKISLTFTQKSDDKPELWYPMIEQDLKSFLIAHTSVRQLKQLAFLHVPQDPHHKDPFWKQSLHTFSIMNTTKPDIPNKETLLSMPITDNIYFTYTHKTSHKQRNISYKAPGPDGIPAEA